MRVNAREALRRRPWVGITGSLLLHVLLIGALVWVKSPASMTQVKRGEPLFVELPQAEEEALKGLPGGAAPEPPKAPVPRPAPPVAKAVPRAPAPPAAKPAPARSAIAKAPAPERATEPAPPRATELPRETPLVASAPKPAEQPNEAPREAAEPTAPPRVASAPPSREPAPDIRSGLRPEAPGTGGAGGAGEGRAGIEGEPIPLDSKDPKFNDYLNRVRQRIKSKWVFPCVKDEASGHCEYKSALLVIEFGILKDGRVPFVIVRQQSGYDVMDDYATNAIKLASPFDPVPESLARGKKGIPILATFSYIVESSLTNLLR